MRKFFVYTITIALLLTVTLTNFSENANAQANYNNYIFSNETENIEQEVENGNQYINQHLNEEESVEVKSTIQKNGENISYKLGNNNVSIENNLDLNLEDEELVFDVEIDNETNGLKENKSFDVIITEVNGEDFKATFVDQDNGTSYNYDSTEMSASVAPLVPVIIAFAAKYGIKKLVKKYGKKLILKTFRGYATKQAVKKLGSFTVKSKHLTSTGGRWAKFNTSSQSTVKKWMKEALNSKDFSFTLNNHDKLSFVVTKNLGKKIGTKGETKIKIVIGANGKIWTTHPVR
ncbi:SAR2788 family putative toxin [Virgibacillus halodenitrificans]|uniref:SAR2788 family putative toxin n=1 Tax=Virgibacillus halodenitrificans TaxID=1482 RepID=UPI001F2C4D3D|nr:SAR2788 family putative toxin [Virgibacillus halodenitrificans]